MIKSCLVGRHLAINVLFDGLVLRCFGRLEGEKEIFKVKLKALKVEGFFYAPSIGIL